MPQYESYENCVKLSDFIYSRSIKINIYFKILMNEISKCRKNPNYFFITVIVIVLHFIYYHSILSLCTF